MGAGVLLVLMKLNGLPNMFNVPGMGRVFAEDRESACLNRTACRRIAKYICLHEDGYLFSIHHPPSSTSAPLKFTPR